MLELSTLSTDAARMVEFLMLARYRHLLCYHPFCTTQNLRIRGIQAQQSPVFCPRRQVLLLQSTDPQATQSN